ncbi:MAG: PhnD/SsuA/transferrin family substrate-binding protein [Thalassovita sp.]|nr:PhnD/SsuA/transferrin family substrate-binding protein [Thalassovita sp.]
MVRALAVFFALVLSVCSPAPSVAQTGDRTARIGVLAFRGAEAAHRQWDGLSTYLSQTIDGWQFNVVPVTLISAPEMIAAKRIDFLITNPGHFVSLAADYPLSALATLERSASPDGSGLLTYGSVILVRSQSEIRAISDLRDKSLAAVSPDAFGGFQIAWSELQRHGIDALNDLGSIRFMGFPQDEIVLSVLAGEAEAGVVRSGLLESLAAEGHIDLGDFRVLNGASQPDYPFLVTGHLYPEWPFLAAPGINKHLREAVTIALLQSQQQDIRTRFDLRQKWSAPLSYEGVRQLVWDYRQQATPSPATAATLGINQSMLAVTALLLAAAVWWFSRRRPALIPSAPLDLDDTGTDPDDLAETRARFEALTRRERQVLCMICEGQTNKAIAELLGISPKTVEFHRANLLQKTDAGTTAHLVQLATRLGCDQGFTLGETRQ